MREKKRYEREIIYNREIRSFLKNKLIISTINIKNTLTTTIVFIVAAIITRGIIFRVHFWRYLPNVMVFSH